MSSNPSTTTSLTAPWDRELGAKIVSHPPLTSEEARVAVEQNLVSNLTQTFPKVDRAYADPTYNNQLYCLHSFVPSKNAKPDEHGVFGFMKCRGCFSSTEEANQRAEFIIQNFDSYHEIHTGYVGRPFPIAMDTKQYVQETKEIDIRKRAMETISEDVRAKRDSERKEIEDIKEREKKLLDQSEQVKKGTYVEDPLDKYTTLHVKKANLIFTYIQSREKMNEMQKIIRAAYKEIREMDKEDASLSSQYFEKYMAARRAANIPDEASEENWMKYLCEDAKLDFDY